MPRATDPSGEHSPLKLSDVLEAELALLYPGALAEPLAPSEDDERRLRALFAKIHALPDGPTALCLSGGGIRSATFGLGVLQGLARRKLLDRFDYLSTVSGGGYIGAWLTALSHRRGGVGQVSAMMQEPSAGTTTQAETQPVDFLRNYSNYLTPQLGLFSADTWAAVATVFRNLLLNWLLLLPALALLLMLPRFGVTIAALGAPAGWAQWVLLGVAVGTLAIAVAYVELDLPSAGDGHGPQPRFLMRYLAPLIAAAIALTVYWRWYGCDVQDPGVMLVAFGAGAHVVGFGLGRICRLFTSRAAAAAKGASELLEKVFEPLVVAVVGAFGGLLAWLLSRSLPAALFADECAVQQAVAHQSAVRTFVWLAVPGLLLIWVIATALYVGLASRWTNDEDREWFARATGWVLLMATAWFALGGVVLFVPDLLATNAPRWLKWAMASTGGIGTLTTLLAARSATTPASEEADGSGTSSLVSLDGLVSKLAAPAAVIFLFALLALGTDWLLQKLPKAWVSFGWSEQLARLLVLALAFGLLLVIANALINVNRFSLHALYRNRLVRAFLGASRTDRQQNPFTGFDPQDNIEMCKLNAVRPFHVVNITLNLVRGQRLAWQHRKAESFTVSSLHSGSSACDSYRPSSLYGGRGGITLGTAVAISGAAASPNMGYHSSPLASLLMTLFNVRLGWWLGNPRAVGDKTWRLPGPGFAIGPIIAEALGLTDDENRHVYLSDGGHFENLGLYEMVLRRCATIVVVDGGCDPKYEFEDFGNAVRKISIDLGIPIQLDGALALSAEARRQVRCYTAKIEYSKRGEARDGTLVYLKPALLGDEPVDIRNYAATHSDFPHETTGDQWFDEDQFESYRGLGELTAYAVFGRSR